MVFAGILTSHPLCRLALLGMAGLLFMIAGCTPEDQSRRITIWHQKTESERTFFNEIIAAYNRNHPDREVEILYKETEDLRRLFVVASVGGQGPDLVYGPSDNTSVFALTETIRPLDEVLDPGYLATFDQAGIIQWKDKPWLIADQVGNHLVFVYNKQFIPEPPANTDEMIEMLSGLTIDEDGDGKPERYGLTWNYTEPFFFIPFLNGYGGQVMDEDGNPTLDNETTASAIQFILDLRDKYKVIPPESDYNIAETLFKEGRAAAIINGPWSWSGYGEAGIDYGLARIPVVTETGLWAAPFISAKGYSVNVNVPEEKLPLIQELLHYLTGAEMQTMMADELSAIPALKALRTSNVVVNNPTLQSSLQQVEVGIPMPIQPQMRQIWDGMRGPYQLVMNGAVTAREGARLMQLETEKLIADTFL